MLLVTQSVCTLIISEYLLRFLKQAKNPNKTMPLFQKRDRVIPVNLSLPHLFLPFFFPLPLFPIFFSPSTLYRHPFSMFPVKQRSPKPTDNPLSDPLEEEKGTYHLASVVSLVSSI